MDSTLITVQTPSEKQLKLERYLKFLSVDQHNHTLVLDALALCLELNDLAAAERIFIEYQAALGASPVFCGHIGYLFLLYGDYEQSLQFFNRAMELGNHDVVIMFNSIVCYFGLNQHQKAYEMLLTNTGIADILPFDYAILMARLMHHLDDLGGAIATLRGLQDQHGWRAESAGLQALIMYEAGIDVSDVLQLSNRALVENPLLIEALLARISANMELGDYNTALGDALTATTHHPRNGRAWSSLAQVYFNDLNFQSAKVAAEEAVKFLSQHIGTWHILAWSHMMLKEYENALSVFEKSYKIDSRFAETHGGLAAAYAHLKQNHLAGKHLKIAKKLDPACFAAMYADIVLLREGDRAEEADKLFEQSLNSLNTKLGMAPGKLVEKRLLELSKNRTDSNLH